MRGGTRSAVAPQVRATHVLERAELRHHLVERHPHLVRGRAGVGG